MTLKRAIFLTLFWVIWGCDSAPGPGSANDFDNAVALSAAVPVPVLSRMVSGRGSKGPLINSSVQVLAIDAQGYPLEQPPIASTVTDAAGNWELLIDNGEDYLVVVAGGRYVDEADTNVANRRVITLSDGDQLLSILPADATTVAVTVFSDALVEKSRRETGATDFSAVVAANRNLFRTALGFDVLTVLPADPLAPSGNAEQIAYAMAVGGVANAINSLSIAMQDARPDYRHIQWISRDLIDCRLDGLGIGGRTVLPVTLAGTAPEPINQQILRFRNNNFYAYQGQRITEIDAAPCTLAGGTADTVPPVIISSATIATLDAQSAAGVVVDQSLIDTARVQFSATDDRVGELHWELGLPAQLAIGDNVLSATVTDAWGNSSSTAWRIAVADLSAPVFVTPAIAEATAVGDLTPLVLVPPLVSDNVTEAALIVLVNDAPAEGFGVGDTDVTWQATDEAGLTSSTVQRVRINSLAPVVIAAPPVLSYAGSAIDFSAYFSDPDLTTLSYAISGLPPGTGLLFDSAGVLSGTPTAADFAAQPLALEIVASDGQNTVTLQTELEIFAPNTPPAFSLSLATVELDEDFGAATVTVTAAPVPVSELGQSAVYSISATSPGPYPLDFAVNPETGQVTLTALNDASGEVTLRITANDGQSINATYFQDLPVSVLSVNDAPQVVSMPLIPELVTGQFFSQDLSAAFRDVDDATLTYSAAQLPASMSFSDSGVLAGVPRPVDGAGGPLPLAFSATDSGGEQAVLALSIVITDPDTDGDGLSDYQENLLGLDPSSTDSDDDGFADNLETLVTMDASDVVLYVRPSGDDTASGLSPGTAIASLTTLSERIASIAASQRIVVLMESTDNAYTGNLSIGPGMAERVLVGSVRFFDTSVNVWLADAPSSALVAESGRIVSMNGCYRCAFYYLALRDSPGALSANDSQVVLGHVRIVNNYSVEDGAALRISGGQLDVRQAHIAGNTTAGDGAALHATGMAPQVTLRDSVITGNFAFGQGAVLFQMDGNTQGVNLLITANGAGHATLAAVQGTASIALRNSTVAYNYLNTAVDAPLFALSPASELTITDNIVINNGTSTGQDALISAGTTSGGHNLVSGSSPLLPGDLAVSPGADFSGSYALGDALSAAVDSGSSPAATLAVEELFSIWQSYFPDSGIADRGYHFAHPVTGIPDYEMSATYRDAFGYRHDRYEVDIRIFADDQPLGAGHRVRVGTVGLSPKARATGPSRVTVDAEAATVLAIAMGNGVYRTWLNNFHVLNRDFLQVFIDDDEAGRLIVPVCGRPVCGAPPDTVSR